MRFSSDADSRVAQCIRWVNQPMKARWLSWLPPAWAAWIYTVVLKPQILRKAAQRIICYLIPPEIELGGVNLVLNQDDAIVSGNLALGCYETFNVELFESLLRPGMCVMDVGANIGLYSAIAAHKVGSAGTVIAIEPDATNCSFIARTKERNGFANLSIIQKAAGAVNGKAALHLSKMNKADHRTYGGDQSRTSISVEMTTLDSLSAELRLSQVDVLKIDTQGFEAFVAEGMKELIRRSPDIHILMEFWPWGIGRAGGSASELLDFFTSREFTISIIDDYKKKIDRLDHFGEILRLSLERQHVNLYLRRQRTSSR